jgi:hypothetical protein
MEIPASEEGEGAIAVAYAQPETRAGTCIQGICAAGLKAREGVRIIL